MQNNLSRFLFGERLPWLPPERVRQTFAEQESQSEILVGWVQLVLVGFFIAIYSLSPKTSAGTAFQPVPWVLGVYLFVTLLRLWLSYRTVQNHRARIADALGLRGRNTLLAFAVRNRARLR